MASLGQLFYEAGVKIDQSQIQKLTSLETALGNIKDKNVKVTLDVSSVNLLNKLQHDSIKTSDHLQKLGDTAKSVKNALNDAFGNKSGTFKEVDNDIKKINEKYNTLIDNLTRVGQVSSHSELSNDYRENIAYINKMISEYKSLGNAVKTVSQDAFERKLIGKGQMQHIQDLVFGGNWADKQGVASVQTVLDSLESFKKKYSEIMHDTTSASTKAGNIFDAFTKSDITKYIKDMSSLESKLMSSMFYMGKNATPEMMTAVDTFRKEVSRSFGAFDLGKFNIDRIYINHVEPGKNAAMSFRNKFIEELKSLGAVQVDVSYGSAKGRGGSKITTEDVIKPSPETHKKSSREIAETWNELAATARNHSKEVQEYYKELSADKKMTTSEKNGFLAGYIKTFEEAESNLSALKRKFQDNPIVFPQIEAIQSDATISKMKDKYQEAQKVVEQFQENVKKVGDSILSGKVTFAQLDVLPDFSEQKKYIEQYVREQEELAKSNAASSSKQVIEEENSALQQQLDEEKKVTSAIREKEEAERKFAEEQAKADKARGVKSMLDTMKNAPSSSVMIDANNYANALASSLFSGKGSSLEIDTKAANAALEGIINRANETAKALSEIKEKDSSVAVKERFSSLANSIQEPLDKLKALHAEIQKQDLGSYNKKSSDVKRDIVKYVSELERGISTAQAQYANFDAKNTEWTNSLSIAQFEVAAKGAENISSAINKVGDSSDKTAAKVKELEDILKRTFSADITNAFAGISAQFMKLSNKGRSSELPYADKLKAVGNIKSAYGSAFDELQSVKNILKEDAKDSSNAPFKKQIESSLAELAKLEDKLINIRKEASNISIDQKTGNVSGVENLKNGFAALKVEINDVLGRANALQQALYFTDNKFLGGIIDIKGPGTSTSDSIRALLSAGESVMTASVTSMFKDYLHLFQAIGGGAFDKSNVEMILQRFAKTAENESKMAMFDSARTSMSTLGHFTPQDIKFLTEQLNNESKAVVAALDARGKTVDLMSKIALTPRQRAYDNSEAKLGSKDAAELKVYERQLELIQSKILEIQNAKITPQYDFVQQQKDLEIFGERYNAILAKAYAAKANLQPYEEINAALDKHQARVDEIKRSLVEVEKQMERLKATGGLFDNNGKFTEEALKLEQQRVLLTTELNQKTMSASELQKAVTKELLDQETASKKILQQREALAKSAINIQNHINGLKSESALKSQQGKDVTELNKSIDRWERLLSIVNAVRERGTSARVESLSAWLPSYEASGRANDRVARNTDRIKDSDISMAESLDKCIVRVSNHLSDLSGKIGRSLPTEKVQELTNKFNELLKTMTRSKDTGDFKSGLKAFNASKGDIELFKGLRKEAVDTEHWMNRVQSAIDKVTKQYVSAVEYTSNRVSSRAFSFDFSNIINSLTNAKNSGDINKMKESLASYTALLEKAKNSFRQGKKEDSFLDGMTAKAGELQRMLTFLNKTRVQVFRKGESTEGIDKMIKRVEHLIGALQTASTFSGDKLAKAAPMLSSYSDRLAKEAQSFGMSSLGIGRESAKQVRDFELAQIAARVATSEHTNALKDMLGQTFSLQNQFSQLGMTIQNTFSIIGLQKFADSIIKIGGEIEKQKLAMGSIFGDNDKSEELYGKLSKLSMISPFSVEEVMKYSKQLAAFGIQYDELYETTKRLADIAAGVGVDFGRIAYEFGQTSSRGWLDARELRMFANSGIPLLAKLSEYYSNIRGTKVSSTDVRNMISKREVSFGDVKNVIWGMTDQGGTFYNMQEVMAESLAAKWRNLSNAWNLMLADLAQNSTAGEWLKDLATWLTELTQKWKSILPAVVAASGALLTYKTLSWLTVGSMNARAASLVKESLAIKASAVSENAKKLAMEGNIVAATKLLVAQNGVTASEFKQMAAATSLSATQQALAIKNGILGASFTALGTKAKWATLSAAGFSTWTKIGACVPIVGRLAIGFGQLGNMIKAAGMALWSNPWAIVASAIAAIGYAIYNSYQEAHRLDNKLQDLANESNKDLSKQTKTLEYYRKKLLDANTTLEERREIVKALRNEYGEYFTNLKEESNDWEDIAKQIQNATAALENNAKVKLRQKQIDAIIEEESDNQVKAENGIRTALREKTQMSDIEIEDIISKIKQLAKEGLTANQIMKGIGLGNGRWIFEKDLFGGFRNTYVEDLVESIDKVDKKITEIANRDINSSIAEKMASSYSKYFNEVANEQNSYLERIDILKKGTQEIINMLEGEGGLKLNGRLAEVLKQDGFNLNNLKRQELDPTNELVVKYKNQLEHLDKVLKEGWRTASETVLQGIRNVKEKSNIYNELAPNEQMSQLEYYKKLAEGYKNAQEELERMEKQRSKAIAAEKGKKGPIIVWTPEQEANFQKIKELCEYYKLLEKANFIDLGDYASGNGNSNSHSKKDSLNENLKNNLSLLKDMYSEYEKFRKLENVSDAQAGSIVMQSEMFKTRINEIKQYAKKNKIKFDFDIEDFDFTKDKLKSMLDVLKKEAEVLSKSGTADQKEGRLNTLKEVLKELDELIYDDYQTSLDKLQNGIQKKLDEMSFKWDFAKSIIDKTGDVKNALTSAFGSAAAKKYLDEGISDYASILKSNLLTDLFEEARKIKDSKARGTALSGYYNLNKKRNFEELYNKSDQELQNMFAGATPTVKEYLKAIHDAEQGMLKERQSKYVEALEETQSYLNKRNQITTEYDQLIKAVDKDLQQENDVEKEKFLLLERQTLELKKQRDLAANDYEVWQKNPNIRFAFDNLSESSAKALNILSGDIMSKLSVAIKKGNIENAKDAIGKLFDAFDAKAALKPLEMLKESQDIINSTNIEAARINADVAEKEYNAAFEKLNNAKTTEEEIIAAKELREATKKRNEANAFLEASEEKLYRAFKLRKKAVDEFVNSISKLGDSLSEFGNSIGGSWGEVFKLGGDTLKYLSSAKENMSTISKSGWSGGGWMSSGSAILSMASGYINLAKNLGDAVANIQTNMYERAARKQADINAMIDVVWAYKKAITEARQEEEAWFGGTTSHKAIKNASEGMRNAYKHYIALASEAQEQYVNKSGKGWGTYLIAGIIAAAGAVAAVYSGGASVLPTMSAIGSVLGASGFTASVVTGFAAVGIAAATATTATIAGVEAIVQALSYESGKVAAINNLMIETREVSKGFWGTGWGGHNQETANLQEWLDQINKIKDAYAKYATGKMSQKEYEDYTYSVGDKHDFEKQREFAKQLYAAGIDNTNLFDEWGMVNVKLAKAILENESLSGKLVGETKETLQRLTEVSEEWQEYHDQLLEAVNQMYSPLMDTMVEAIWDWFDNGADALDSFKNKASDVFRDIASDMLKTMLQREIFQKYGEELGKLYTKWSTPGYDYTDEMLANDMAALTGQMVKDAEQFIPFAESWTKLLDTALKSADIPNGLTSSDTSSGMTSSIKGVTEPTAEILAAYINGMRLDLSVQRSVVEQIAVHTGLIASVLTNGSEAQLAALQAANASVNTGSDEYLPSGELIQLMKLNTDVLPLMSAEAINQTAQLRMIVENTRLTAANTQQCAEYTQLTYELFNSVTNGTKKVYMN